MCFNLSRCDERIGSETRRQPTKSPKRIGKPVLNPTSDESKRKDKLKKRKNEHTISHSKQNLPTEQEDKQKRFVHFIVNIAT